MLICVFIFHPSFIVTIAKFTKILWRILEKEETHRRYKHSKCQRWYWFYLINTVFIVQEGEEIIINYLIIWVMEMKLQCFMVNDWVCGIYGAYSTSCSFFWHYNITQKNWVWSFIIQAIYSQLNCNKSGTKLTKQCICNTQYYL